MYVFAVIRRVSAFTQRERFSKYHAGAWAMQCGDDNFMMLSALCSMIPFA